MTLTFDGVAVAAESVHVESREPWSDYLRVRAADIVGWYGPVSTESARRALGLAAIADGFDGRDHAALHLSLLPSCETQEDFVALGVLDAAFWDLDARQEGCDLAALLGASDETREIPGYASLLPVDLRRDDSPEAVARHLDDTTQLAKFSVRMDRRQDPTEVRATWILQAERALQFAPSCAFDFRGNLTEAQASALVVSPHADAATWLEDLIAPYDGAAYKRIAEVAPRVTLGLGEYLSGDDPFLPKWLAALSPIPAITLDVISCGGISRALTLLADAARLECAVYLHGRHLRAAAAIAMARPHQVKSVEVQIIWELNRSKLHRHPINATTTSISRMSVNGIGAEPPDA